ncbi:MAG: hypothetical protein AAF571_01230 [Verrucomicrobiota bacterium]
MTSPTPLVSTFPPPPENKEKLLRSHVLSELFSDEALGASLSGNLSAQEILFQNNIRNLPDILYINWTEWLALAMLKDSPIWIKLLFKIRFLFSFFVRYFVRRALRKFKAGGTKIIYHVHDLHSNWLIPDSPPDQVDQILKYEIFKLCDGLVIHEPSALDPIKEHHPVPPKVAVCPLGGYDKFHGDAADRIFARTRLGISKDSLVFFCFGYFQSFRNPSQLVDAFMECCDDNWRLIVAGSNSGTFLDQIKLNNQIQILDEFIDDPKLRDLFCASDWVIMNGQQHLTSAVARTAISYSRPVICEAYGSQIDMLEGCSIPLAGQSRDDYIHAYLRAADTSPEACNTLELSAKRSHDERSWKNFHTQRNRLISDMYLQSQTTPA